MAYAEVKSVYDRMGGESVLVISQHLPRVHRKLLLYRTFNRLVEEVGYPIPTAVSDNQIAFIILTTNKRRQKEVRKLLDE